MYARVIARVVARPQLLKECSHHVTTTKLCRSAGSISECMCPYFVAMGRCAFCGDVRNSLGMHSRVVEQLKFATIVGERFDRKLLVCRCLIDRGRAAGLFLDLW